MMKGLCPDTFYCSNGTHAYSAIKTSLLIVPAYVALVSSLLSCLGAALIVIAYCAFKDLRKGTTQTIVTLLALSDLGTAVSGIFGASLFMGYDHLVQKSEKECYIFDMICQIQGFMTTSSEICGFIWTSVLAIHLLLVTTCTYSTWINKLLPLYNSIAWTVPLTIALPLLFFDQFGYNPNLRWTCYLRWNSHKGTKYVWWILVPFSTAIIFIGYTVILVYISCKQTCRLRNSTTWRVNRRIFVILVAYIILRIPDVIKSIYGAIHKQECLDDPNQVFEFIISTLEIVTDRCQGWVNCILYIFLSSEMRRRMFVLPFRRAVSRCKRRKVTQNLRTSMLSPMLEHTHNTLTTQGRARERGETYISFQAEYSEAQNSPDGGENKETIN